MTKVQVQAETLGFQAEVNQLLHLVTHSLYSNKEIFLRELISNASDAADKLRFEALNDSALYESNSDLKIYVDFNKKDRTITVRDNGIGMSREEIIEHLGTIAKSGTQQFLKALSGDQKKDANLIGQFGVGFYSAFVVADKVTVKSRRAGMTHDQGVVWESNGESEFSVENINMAERGTEITLHLKKDEDEFLNDWRLRSIITKYSDHILWPVIMKKEIIPELTKEQKDKKEKPKPEIKDEVINSAKALWALPKTEIKDDDYKELYKHISHDFNEPLTWAHNKVEGKLEYTTLLYLPKHAPFDLWNRDNPHGLKLYVQRVFIMDDAKQLLPLYLRFVRGIVDSNDLPLNISREILQNNKTIDSIRSGVVKRVLDMLDKMSKTESEKYQEFWREFGNVIKEGVGEDFANRDKIAKLLRFSSTHVDGSEQIVTLDDYISRMKPEQKHIYYVTADSYIAAKNSPHLEVLNKKDIEVLLLHDRVDEWLIAHLTEYDGKKLQSVARGDLDIGDLHDKQDKALKDKNKKEFETVIKQMKDILGERVKDIRLTSRLTDSPACLISDEQDLSGHMQRMLEAAGQAIPSAKPILELNPEHVLVVRLKSEQDDDRFSEWSNILFDQALLAEGGQLDDPATFVKRLNKLLAQ